jgi:hypothetical protein
MGVRSFQIVVCFALGTSPAMGQAMSAERRRALAEQAALADGYRQLRAKVAELAVDASHTLSDLTAPSTAAAIELRRLVTQAEPAARTRFYDNGDAEVDLRLPLKPVIEALQKLQATSRPSGQIEPPDLNALARRAATEQILVTGRGSPPTEDELTGPPGWPGGKDAGDLPPAGWGGVTPAGFKAAERAAELDALDHLGRLIGRLRMDRSRTLEEVAAVVPAIGAGLRQPFNGVKVTPPEYLPEQLCRLYAEVDVHAVVDRLRQLKATPDIKADLSDSDIDSIVRLATAERLRAVGYGVPPSSAIRQKSRFAVVDVDEPAWAGRVLRATAGGTIERSQQAQDEERAVDVAVQDARIAAQLKLAEQIDRLELPGGWTVGAFLARHEELADDLLRFLSAAERIHGPTIDRAARTVGLTLELPLRRLWLILRPAIPAVETTTQPG